MTVINTIAFDDSTSEVIEWLDFFGQEVIRVNSDSIATKSLNRLLPIPSRSNSLDSLWLRKESSPNDIAAEPHDIQRDIIGHSLNELLYFRKGILDYFKCYRLGTDNYFRLNKILILEKFKLHGLTTPPTLVTYRKQDLIKFIHENGMVVVKPISDGQSFIIKGKLYRIYTTIVNEFVETLEDEFFPSLFQKYIDKKFEIRSFFLNGAIMSMAIFSQENEKTKIDFRQYVASQPVRLNTFKLPENIESKIRLVMDELNLNIGVFDIIRDTADNYIFLEVNPWGQFGDISKNCNQFIEKQIALALKNKTYE